MLMGPYPRSQKQINRVTVSYILKAYVQLNVSHTLSRMSFFLWTEHKTQELVDSYMSPLNNV